MDKNIVRVRLLGILTFAALIVISAVKLFNGNYNADYNIVWYRRSESLLIFVSFACFAYVFALQVYRIIVARRLNKKNNSGDNTQD